MCSDHVKCTLFRSFCTSLYTCQLWCNYKSESIRKLFVAYNNVELSLFSEIQYNDNIKYCQFCSTGTSRISTAKYNTHDKRNIIMTDDLHVPITCLDYYANNRGIAVQVISL